MIQSPISTRSPLQDALDQLDFVFYAAVKIFNQMLQISESNGGILAQKSVCNQLNPRAVWTAFISGSYDLKGLFYRQTFALNISVSFLFLLKRAGMNGPFLIHLQQ